MLKEFNNSCKFSINCPNEINEADTYNLVSIIEDVNKGYENINLGSVEPSVDKLLKETKIIK